MISKEEAKEYVFSAIRKYVKCDVTESTVLLGSDIGINSMQLVELCLELEDKSLVFGFEFDWTSDVAMSRSRSMFRTAGSLASEFIDQMETKK
jgi:acyl carrier protein